jgi:hypothetical protein
MRLELVAPNELQLPTFVSSLYTGLQTPSRQTCHSPCNASRKQNRYSVAILHDLAVCGGSVLLDDAIFNFEYFIKVALMRRKAQADTNIVVSCKPSICDTWLARVLKGTLNHRDSFLSVMRKCSTCGSRIVARTQNQKDLS